MTLWIIGFLFSMGFVVMISDEKQKWYEPIIATLALIVFWPFFIGTAVGYVLKKKDEEQK